MINSLKAASKGAALALIQRKEKIYKVIYWILLLFVFLLLLLPTLSFLDINLPFKLYSVQTGSMKPTINIGDLIFVKEENDYFKGDIITYSNGSGKSKNIVTHRILEIGKNKEYVTKGDANLVQDADTISKDQIIGKYFFKIPFLGYPINFVKTPIGFVILILIPSLLISSEEIQKIKNSLKKKTPIFSLLLLFFLISDSIYATYMYQKTIDNMKIRTGILNIVVDPKHTKIDLNTQDNILTLHILNIGTLPIQYRIEKINTSNDCQYIYALLEKDNNIYNIQEIENNTQFIPSSNISASDILNYSFFLKEPLLKKNINCEINIHIIAWQSIYSSPKYGFFDKEVINIEIFSRENTLEIVRSEELSHF